MPIAPGAVVFDVNETLSDLGAMRAVFGALGVDPQLAGTWFAATLRDGFALTLAGVPAPFAEVAAASARTILGAAGGAGAAGAAGDVPDAAERVLAEFRGLDVHPDVVQGVLRLGAGGHRLVTLSNGAPQVAHELLTRAGIRDSFTDVLSVADVGVWKPHPDAYRHAVRSTGLEAGELLMVAVHPWDLDGAARAGLRTAWLCRDGDVDAYPPFFAAPEIQVRDLVELADVLDADASG